MIGNIGMGELLLIFLAILLIFGAKRIPEIARGMGKGIREFKDATKDIKREMNFDDQPNYRIEPPHYGAPAPRPPEQYGAMPAADPYAAPQQQAPPAAAPQPVNPDPAAKQY